jgi:hypothetical protein
MFMKTLLGSTFAATVRNIPLGAKLAEVGPRDYVAALKNYAFGSNVRVISNEPLNLKDGTQAFRTDIEWVWKSGIQLRTIVVSVFKEGKWINISYNLVATIAASVPEKLKEGSDIVESLTFNENYINRVLPAE